MLSRLPDTHVPSRAANLRFLALAGSLVLIVFIGYVVRQRVTDETVASFRWLEHSHAVRTTIFDLDASLSELQAAAYARALTPDNAVVQRRYEAARDRYPPLLERLRELTTDNPRQQEGVGYLRARIADTVDRLDQAWREQVPFDTEAARFSIGEVTDELLAEEDRLARERQATTDRRVRFADLVTLFTALGQAVFLCIVIWLAERQTQRRLAAEAAQRHAIGRARLIVESVREPIAVVDGRLRLLHANGAFGDFYGMHDPEVPLDEVPGWGDAVLVQRLRDVMALGRELWDYEVAQGDAVGSERLVIVNARPIDLPDAEGGAALVTVSDITARKRSEEQVLELNRQLSGKIEQVTEVNRELEAFSYSVSHDLRAPLRHIAGFADKLNAAIDAEAEPKLAHYCAIIADSARRMSTLIEDLLAYSRLGRHALRLQPVDLQSLVEEVRSTLVSAVEDRRIEWRIAPLPVVVGDSAMLRLAWQNLLDNAIKYTAGRDPARIEIGFREEGEAREFWVRDDGVGFDMKYVDKLFGVFQRLHKASEFQGTGIGLASVRRIVARHGGRTWAEAEPGQGATVHFTLPRYESST